MIVSELLCAVIIQESAKQKSLSEKKNNKQHESKALTPPLYLDSSSDAARHCQFMRAADLPGVGRAGPLLVSCWCRLIREAFV